MSYDYREANELNDEELINLLTKNYQPSEIPRCIVCGGKLGIAAMGGGGPTEYACSGTEDDPDNEGFVRYKEGRRPADDHYSKSRHTDYRRGGDSDVMELIKRYNRVMYKL